MLRIGVISYSPKIAMNNILPFLRELEEANGNIIYHKDKETLVSLPPESIDDVQYIFLIRDMDKYAGIQLDQLIRWY